MAPEGLDRNLTPAHPECAAVLEGAGSLLLRRLPGPAGEDAQRFLGLWASSVPDEDLAARSPEDVAGAALSLFDHVRHRTPGQASVRVLNPRPEAEGWRSAHSIAEIVTDDMPFLVDSALAGIAIAGRAVHLVVHPIVPVRRSPDGTLVAFGDAAGPDAPRESMMQIEFAQGVDSAELATVAAALKRAMADVRTAVTDWPEMRARLAEAIEVLDGPSDEEARIAREFLAWLAIVFRTWGGFIAGYAFALLGVGLFMLTGKLRWLYWPVAFGAVIAFGRFLFSNIVLSSDFLWFISFLFLLAVVAATLLAFSRDRPPA